MQIVLGAIILVVVIILAFLIVIRTKNNQVQSLGNDNGKIVEQVKKEFSQNREDLSRQISSGANDQFARFDVIQRSIQETLQSNRNETNSTLETQIKSLQKIFESFVLIQTNIQTTLQTSRTETNEQLGTFSRQIEDRLQSIQRQSNENNEKTNSTLETKIKSLQESNEKRLEQMQGVVDEKLQKTLETRLTQSFELVGKQLDSVQQGLGEMKNLAADAKSLKNALINVKDRGTFGEIRLEKLISDILSADQYLINAEINKGKWVEFAIKLPGNGDENVLLPIDSKFPIEDYNRLLDAEDKQSMEAARKSLSQQIKNFAKEISDKYISPPKTTDFAFMFLPTEGLYAEVVRDNSLIEELRTKYKVHVTAPSTMAISLNALLSGFKTLAIEKNAIKVWDTLSAVKTEFGKFGVVLKKAQDQIDTVGTTLSTLSGVRTRAINRALKGVTELDSSQSQSILSIDAPDYDEDAG